jgi:hypothetical protein
MLNPKGFCQNHGGKQGVQASKENSCQKSMNGVEAYKCHTCAKNDNLLDICADCFRNANHDGHNWEKYTAYNRVCDCGVKDGNLKQSGFCQNHGGPVKKQEARKICGKNLPSGSEAYRCHTCQKSGTMALCPSCFHNGNHKGNKSAQ